MGRGGIEVERKFVLPAADATVPDLRAVPGVAEVAVLAEETLEAVYHDTTDLRLARSRATLRRRTGGRDAGWHLKLPSSGEARLEITAPLSDDGVPGELAVLVRSRSRGAELVPVARVHTVRAVRQLLAADRRVLAEVADDRVTAASLGPSVTAATWREVEVELVDGDVVLLDAVQQVLVAAGARPSASRSKLAQALGDRLPAEPEPGPTAGDVVVAHLRSQVAELVARDPLVRRDEPDAVHKMRVATRRLRSALRTFRPLLERAVTDPLRAELRHLAGVLGEARDAEVLRDRLLAEVAAQPDELVLGPVAARVADHLGGRYRQGHDAVVAELDGPRYLALLDALDALVTEPPLTARAARPAGPELRRRVRRTWQRLAAAERAASAAPPDGRDHLLHEVRKAAKQARYAGEAVVTCFGRDAERFAAAAEGVQEALGEHQDAVVAREALRQLGVAAHLAGENGFTFGRLHGLQDARADAARRRFAPAWAELTRRRTLAWLQ